jgi:hypothetical protein
MHRNSGPAQQTRVCEHCGCTFQSRNKIQKYHNPSCEKKAYNLRNAEKIRAVQRARRAADPETYRAWQREYRRGNAEKIRAQGRAAYARNADKRRVQERERRAADPEKYRLRQREYRKQNAEKVRARQARYYTADPDRYRAYARTAYAKNPDKLKARSRARNLHIRAKLAEAERLTRVEGLDLKTGLRASLAAHAAFQGKKPYQMARDVCPDSVDAFDAIKKLFRRFPTLIEDEKKRVAKLPENLRQTEAENLAARLKRELAKPKKPVNPN